MNNETIFERTQGATSTYVTRGATNIPKLFTTNEGATSMDTLKVIG